ncbi:hypothetical protein ACFUOZ_10640 [Paenarthrobacter sp. NPDC057355]|uniref:hypothetical protein n=1 Tax=Paenarthrobacter sp. NPDC057355 TaxID=3346105 RepID=UPI0036447140
MTALDKRRARKFQIAGGLLLGAAAVTTGVLVAAYFGPVSATPAPAATVTSADATATPTASAPPSPTATPTASPAATPTAVATPQPTSTPVATVPVAAPTPISTTTLPHAAQVQSYTFPDGHLSFSYPVGWSVKTEQGPYLSEETKAASQGATVMDSAGTPVAYVYSGFYGDGTGAFVKRTVFDQAPVTEIMASDAPDDLVQFGFFSDVGAQMVEPGQDPAAALEDQTPHYSMDVRRSSQLGSGLTGSGTNQIKMPNGIMAARVIFDYEKQPIFATPEAAKAWMGTTQYQQLKSLLLSLRYQ